MKILVTGGAGFIGSNLVKALLAQGYEVVCVDNLQTGNLFNLVDVKNSSKFNFVKCNVNDYEEFSPVFYRHAFDYVYHYAACVGVDRTLKSPLEVLSDIDGIKNILKLSKATGVKRLFYSSSSEVYGEPVHFPQNESTTPLNSRLPYAVIKNLGEVFLKVYGREYGLKYTIFRFFNTFGPGQSSNFVVSKFIKQALHNENLSVYGDGLQTRTFIYVSDNVKATVNAISTKEAEEKVINVGGVEEITVRDLAEKIIKLSCSESKIRHLPPLKEGDMTRRHPDTSLMKKILKVNKLTNFEIGLQKTISYFKKLERNA